MIEKLFATVKEQTGFATLPNVSNEKLAGVAPPGILRFLPTVKFKFPPELNDTSEPLEDTRFKSLPTVVKAEFRVIVEDKLGVFHVKSEND